MEACVTVDLGLRADLNSEDDDGLNWALLRAVGEQRCEDRSPQVRREIDITFRSVGESNMNVGIEVRAVRPCGVTLTILRIVLLRAEVRFYGRLVSRRRLQTCAKSHAH